MKRLWKKVILTILTALLLGVIGVSASAAEGEIDASDDVGYDMTQVSETVDSIDDSVLNNAVDGGGTVASNVVPNMTSARAVQYADTAVLYNDGTLVFQVGSPDIGGHGGIKNGCVWTGWDIDPDYNNEGWYYRCRDILAVDFAAPTHPVSTAFWFYSCSNLTEIRHIDRLDMSDVTDMHDMFAGCSSLTDLNLSSFDTSSATNMVYMFNHCSNLTSLNLTGFNTSNVTHMHYMFNDCPNLSSLSLGSNWTWLGTNHGLRNVSWYSFETAFKYTATTIPNGSGVYVTKQPLSNAVALYNDGTLVFQRSFADVGGHNGIVPGCVWTRWGAAADLTNAPWHDYHASIKAVDFFIPTQPMSTAYWFYECNNLINMYNIDRLDTSIVTSMNHMFAGCSSMTSLDLSTFKTSAVTDMSYFVMDCSGLTVLDFSMFDTSSVISMYCMFGNCSDLVSLNISSFDTSNVTTMAAMFYGCAGLNSLNLSKFNTSNVTDMSDMFNGCSGFVTLKLSAFDMFNVTLMDNMFSNCSNLVRLDISNFDTSSVESMTNTFYNCSSLDSLILGSNWKWVGTNHKLRNISWYDIDTVTKYTATTIPDGAGIYVSELPADTVVLYNDGTLIFQCGVDDIGGHNGIMEGCVWTGWDTDTRYGSEAWVSKASSIATVDFAAPTKALSTARWFYRCIELVEIRNIRKLYTFDVTNMSCMFQGCFKLSTLDLSNFDTSCVTDMSYMFNACRALVSLDVSSFDTSNVTDMGCMFSGCSALTFLDVAGFDTSSVTDMSSMFNDCSGLTSLKMDNVDVSNVKSMNQMFADCSGLVSLKLSNFITSSVTDMSRMFWDCSSLTVLDLSSFDTSNVTHMDYMFQGCTNLVSLNLSSFNTSNVVNTEYMFYRCPGLVTLDLSSFDTSNVTTMDSMFSNCSKLKSLTLSSFDTSNVIIMSDMFYNCKALTLLDVSNFDTFNVTSMNRMFGSCSSLTSLDLSNFDTSNVTTMASMFSGCESIKSLNVSSFDTSSVTSMVGMFSDCSDLTTLDISNFDTFNVTSMSSMFYSCSKLTSLDLSVFNTANVKNMGSMFGYCYRLNSLDLSSFNMVNVTSMDRMFYSCSALKSITIGSDWRWVGISHSLRSIPWYSLITGMRYTATTIPDGAGTYVVEQPPATHAVLYNDGTLVFQRSAMDVGGHDGIVSGCVWTGWDTSNCQQTPGWFSRRTGITAIDFSLPTRPVSTYAWFLKHDKLTEIRNIDRLDTSGVTNMDSMFSGCSGLTALDVSKFDTTNVSDMDNMFYDCSGITSLDVSKFDTANVTSMSGMFRNCLNLESLDLSKFDVSNVLSMEAMFRDCSSLTSIKLPGSDTFNLTNMSRMFDNCAKLTELDISGFNTTNVTTMYAMFYDCNALNSLVLGENWTWIADHGLCAVPWYDSVTAEEYAADAIPSGAGTYVTEQPPARYAVLYNDGTLVFQRDDAEVEGHEGIMPECIWTGWDVATDSDQEAWHDHCSEIKAVDFAVRTTAKSMAYWFYECSNMTDVLGIRRLDTSNTTDMKYMFSGCAGLTSLELGYFRTVNVTDMTHMFSGCSKLTQLTLLNMSTPNVISTANMFYGCSELTYLSLPSLDTSNVTDMKDMFSGCSKLRTLAVGSAYQWVGTNHGLRDVPWYNLDTNEEYTATAIPSNMIATYTTASLIDVTVPTMMAVTVTADGTCVVGAGSIENIGRKPAQVANAVVTGQNGWSVGDYSTMTVDNMSIGTKSIGLRLRQNGRASCCETDGVGLVFDSNAFSVIDPGEKCELDCDFKVPAQKERVDAQPMKIIFTIRLHDVPIVV